MLILASYLYQSEQTLRLGEIATTLVIGMLAVAAVWLLWTLLERPLARFRKVRSRQAEIRKISAPLLPREEQGIAQDVRVSPIRKKEVVGVWFPDRKLFRHKAVYMPTGGLRIGDQGILRYRGKYGIEFIRTSSARDEVGGRYYHFAKRPSVPSKKRRW